MSKLRVVMLVVLPVVVVLVVLAVPVRRARRQAEQARIRAEQSRLRAEQAVQAERAAYVSAARQALSALQDVQALVSAGVTYQEYGRRIADARVAVDRLLRECPDDLVPPSREKIEQGMLCYEIAARQWGEKISRAGDASAYGVRAINEKIMQDVWHLADEHIAAASAALSAPPSVPHGASP
jgi:hypothetical protein